MEIITKEKARVGFTLLEVLISVGIIAGLSILIAQSFFTTTRSNTKTEILKEVKQNGDFAISIMTNMIRNSIQVTSPCLSSGTTASSLSIKNPDGGITTFGCRSDGSVTQIASVSASATEYLTGGVITLGAPLCTDAAMSLAFTCSSQSSGGSTVKISFSLSQKGTPPALFERGQTSFQTSITTRN